MTVSSTTIQPTAVYASALPSNEAVQTQQTATTPFGSATKSTDNTSLVAYQSATDANALAKEGLDAQKALLEQRTQMEADLYSKAFAPLPSKKPELTAAERSQNTDAYQGFIAAATSSANDNKGLNANEQKALAEMQNAFGQAAEYLTPAEMTELMKDVNTQAASVTNWGGRFEDGGYQSVVSVINNSVKTVLEEHEAKYQQATKDRDLAMQMFTGMTAPNNDLANSLSANSMNFKAVLPANANPFFLPPVETAKPVESKSTMDMVTVAEPRPKVTVKVSVKPAQLQPISSPNLWAPAGNVASTGSVASSGASGGIASSDTVSIASRGSSVVIDIA